MTLPPYLQNLFAQTGNAQNRIPILPEAGFKYPDTGIPSAQSLRYLTPDQRGNLRGYESDVAGVPTQAFEGQIEQRAPQGAGLGLSSGPNAAGVGGSIVPMAMGGMAPGPGPTQALVGEQGPEMAQLMPGSSVSPLSGGGSPPMSPLDALNPTSRDMGQYPTRPNLPLVNVPTDKLGPNTTGPKVVQLQQALERVGYLQVPPGMSYGWYGPLTTAAVSRFQDDFGIGGGSRGYWNKQSADLLKNRMTQPGGGPQGPSPYSFRPDNMTPAGSEVGASRLTPSQSGPM
jgi:peptidoglycan hydrolase-like protein with peptidoglycan-binding domain